MGQRLKRLPAMWETLVQSLGWEDPLEKEMATHSSILAWRIPWTEEPGGLHSPQGLKESDTTELLHFHFLLMYTITGPYDTHLFDHQISLKRRKCNLQIDFFLYQLLNYDNFIMLTKWITFVFPALTRA